MTVIPTPVSRITTLVALGLVAIALGALVVSRVAPTELLLSSALMVVVAKGQVVDRTHKELGGLAAVVVVLGSAWGFGAWLSLEDFALWPGLLFTAAAVVVVAGVVPLLGDAFRRWLALRLTPVTALMSVAMVLSWLFAMKGGVGIVVAGLFVVWNIATLLLNVATLDDSDEPVGAAANVVDDIGFLLWNSFVLWARVAPDDAGAAALLWW